MKKLLTLLLVGAFAMSLCVGCKKDEPKTPADAIEAAGDAAEEAASAAKKATE